MNPFLKWAGGKRWLIPKVIGRLPKHSRYFEPFLGSGSLFFSQRPNKAYLSDTNQELINCYRQVKNHCKDILRILRGLKVNKTTYYKIRDQKYLNCNSVTQAAYFIYLNKTCWNGLYRVNNDGHFNVPLGTIKKNHALYEEDALRKASRLLKNASVRVCDFEDGIKGIRKGDFVYFDPPYITTHLKNGFVKYNSSLFSHTDELRLAKVALRLAKKGVYVMASNAAHPTIKEMYNGPFYKNEFIRQSSIAADPQNRKAFTELLVTNFQINIDQ